MQRCNARKTILVVDDDPQVQFAMQKRLVHCGFDVVTAASGREAVRCASQFRPHAILLDVRLPDFDGLEVASVLQDCERTRGIPIVFVTGKVDSHFKETCRQRGGLYYIRKPCDPDLLLHLLNSILDKENHSDEIQRASPEQRKAHAG